MVNEPTPRQPLRVQVESSPGTAVPAHKELIDMRIEKRDVPDKRAGAPAEEPSTELREFFQVVFRALMMIAKYLGSRYGFKIKD